ncbi:hypothetical protein AT251_03065 [Enterovibrio nigricans]|uniref:Uncharacterized protein n=1 Tax=Enterovibrio nigricans DSM 22720 TaxID=1121868 RepID=A0A1T4UBB5_9GAMM|nr:hypothetical protein AT251_03065 [Enterovibrio nigricans]SKA49993.1 hypothetical protein SAMN02745132_01290 [Enterovibrio nigricans DSM 22720]
MVNNFIKKMTPIVTKHQGKTKNRIILILSLSFIIYVFSRNIVFSIAMSILFESIFVDAFTDRLCPPAFYFKSHTDNNKNQVMLFLSVNGGVMLLVFFIALLD